MAQQEVWTVVLMWLVWLGIAVQCLLAWRAFMMEQREGMKLSTRRCVSLTALFLVATVVVLFLSIFRSPQPAASTPAATRLPLRQSLSQQQRDQAAAIQKDIDQKEKEQKGLEEQARPLNEQQAKVARQLSDDRTSLSRIEGREPTFKLVPQSVRQADPRIRADLGLAMLTALLIAGIALLVLGGDLQTLLPAGLGSALGIRPDDRSLQESLDRLATLVQREEYREAVKHARTIPDKKLRSLDELDFLYLRALALIQLAASPEKEESPAEQLSWIETARGDLEYVTDQAPKRDEALYALGIAYSYGEPPYYAKALQAFDRAEPLIAAAMKKNLQRNQSICCLRLAEQMLDASNTDEAEKYFARASRIEEKKDQVAQSRLRIAMINLSRAIMKKDFPAATAVLDKLSAMTDLSDEQKAQVNVVSSSLTAQLALRHDDPAAALRECDKFLDLYLPPGLPELNDDVADETFSPILEADLEIPASIYNGFLFVEAVALSRMAGARRTRLTESQVQQLAAPLLRGLQFVPRQRDLLAALGGLYVAFLRGRAESARRWLEAAIFMGARGRIIRAMLERDRVLEQERGHALDWFRSASSRFLRDPAVAGGVRTALVEELGRFQEFEPMLISLRDKPEIEEEEPTLKGLEERARYLTQLLTSVVIGNSQERFQRLAQVQAEYSACLHSLETTTQTMSALEKRVFAELADTLAMR